jgi:hypothetical protein
VGDQELAFSLTYPFASLRLGGFAFKNTSIFNAKAQRKEQSGHKVLFAPNDATIEVSDYKVLMNHHAYALNLAHPDAEGVETITHWQNIHKIDETLSKYNTFPEVNWVRSAKTLYSRISLICSRFKSPSLFAISLVGGQAAFLQTHHSSGVKPSNKKKFIRTAFAVRMNVITYG